jgi:hypothetical protein
MIAAKRITEEIEAGIPRLSDDEILRCIGQRWLGDIARARITSKQS